VGGHLGKREPEIHGTTTADELNETLLQHAREKGYQLDSSRATPKGMQSTGFMRLPTPELIVW
jgi:3-dehydroquinate dehydratase